MKVLIWTWKHGREIIDATDELAAYYKMFTLVDEARKYCDLYEINSNPGYEADRDFIKQNTLYREAKAGNKSSAKKLINLRKNYEYEEFSIEDVIDPEPDPRLENK